MKGSVLNDAFQRVAGGRGNVLRPKKVKTNSLPPVFTSKFSKVVLWRPTFVKVTGSEEPSSDIDCIIYTIEILQQLYKNYLKNKLLQ